MIRFPISGGVVLIDDCDAGIVFPYYWLAHGNNGPTLYAQRGTGGKTILMHRVILDAPKGVKVDHKNGNGLDNQRHNLRFCTTSQNQMNRRAIVGASGFKGIVFHKPSGKWQAQIKRDGKRKYLGLFATPELAAQRYDVEAMSLFGDFAALNFTSLNATDL